MNKPICCGEVVENQAGGSTFFYCQGCKQEVTARPAASSYITSNPGGDFLDQWTKESKIDQELAETGICQNCACYHCLCYE